MVGRVDDGIEGPRLRSARIGWVAFLAVATLGVGLFGAGCGDGDDETGTVPTEETTAPDEGGEEGEEGGGEEAGGEGGVAIDPSEGDPSAGEQIFAGNCASCHGASGAGGNVGPSLQEPSLAQEEEAVVNQILEGGGGMPAFEDQLSDQEIADVAAYVTQSLARR